MTAYLRELESEAISILREVATEYARPVLLYSVGKDSTVLLHLTRKAFAPGVIPFSALHINTGWKFAEMIAFRNASLARYAVDWREFQNPRGLAEGITPFNNPSYTDIMKTEALRLALHEGRHDAAIGGARRDEEPSRAKERIYSLRTRDQRWQPESQRPEVWNMLNPLLPDGSSLRAFPLSNWTELDVWRYIKAQDIYVSSLYFAKLRKYVDRDGLLITAEEPNFRLFSGEAVKQAYIRFRTLGCWPLTGAIPSTAATVTDIISEIERSEQGERAGRAIDHDRPGSMEIKKREGYF